MQGSNFCSKFWRKFDSSIELSNVKPLIVTNFQRVSNNRSMVRLVAYDEFVLKFKVKSKKEKYLKARVDQSEWFYSSKFQHQVWNNWKWFRIVERTSISSRWLLEKFLNSIRSDNFNWMEAVSSKENNPDRIFKIL